MLFKGFSVFPKKISLLQLAFFANHNRLFLYEWVSGRTAPTG